MKKVITLIAAICFAAVLKAQSLDEGIKMYRYEKYISAEKILAPLATTDMKANYFLGLAQLEQGKIEAAQATFAKYPEDPANISGTARVAFAKKNPTQAMQILHALTGKAKKKDWQTFEYAADAITYSDESGSYQEAIDWYKKSLEQISNNIYIFIALGDAYQHIQGGGGEAMNSYEKATSIDPKSSLAYSRIGKLWYDAKNYPLALENYGKAKDADPQNPLPYRDLANAFERSGNYQKAKENIEKYRELSDPSPEVEDQYMDILFLSKDYQNTVQKVAEILQHGSADCRLYGIKGFSELELNDTVNALKDLKMYFNCPPKKITPIDYINYGRAFLANSQYDSANYYFNKAIQIDTSKNKSDTYRSIAEAFKSKKEYLKAAQWYQKLTTDYPDTQPLDYFWDAVMFYYAKDYENAAKESERYELKYPTQPSATYWRGRVAAAKDPEAKECLAGPFFQKWLGVLSDSDKAEKKNDTKLAYEYLVLCNYNSKNKAEEDKYKELLRAVDPNDDLLKQIEDAEKGGAKPATKGKGK
ncbi:MAG: hypothetical protein JSS82_00330 [Bacteroidetes bacterium]|nr:hypothetical protein [Bacteroidota bacterium]